MQEAIGARFYAAYDSGEIAATCELYSDGSTAQIEAVITLEQHRNKGLGSAVVLAALDVAQSEGHDFVFLIADDDDWPKELYAKLGFDPIGRTFFNFIRSPKP
jgi:predicted GNAT family acetyltransferase